MVKSKLDGQNKKGSNSLLNILIIAEYFPPDIGGAATRAYNVAKGLVMNGCRVTVVTAFPHYPLGDVPRKYRWRPIKAEWMGRIKVIRTFILPVESRGIARRLLLFTSFALSSLFALPLVGETDVIWAANPDILAMIPSMMYGKVKRRPMTTNLDDLSLEDAYALKITKRGSILARMAESVAKMCYRRAKAVTPISPDYVKIIADKYGLSRKRIRVVRGGVDSTVFRSKPQKRIARKRFTVLYSGAFSVAYDFEQVIKAARILENKDDGIEFILQGKGELADQVELRIRELQLRNVRIMDKVLSRKKVAELLSRADALIQPLRDFGRPYLGISTKLYEYQAVGRPIICTSNGTPRRYISDTKSGIVVRPGDSDALASAVIRLKTDSHVAEEMGRNGRMYVEKNLSLESVGSAMAAVFRQVLSNEIPR